MTGFASHLSKEVQKKGPLCVGIDPSCNLLSDWALTDDWRGLETFSARCIEAIGTSAAIIKPQVAFFERHGAAGLSALERVIDLAHQAGLLVLADAKRGDISTTAEAYGDAWLRDDGGFRADALTVVAYLGFAALDPIFQLAKSRGKGIFVVVASSNSEGRLIQQARVTKTKGGFERDESVEQHLLATIAKWNLANQSQESPLHLGGGVIGAVIGATRRDVPFDLATLGGPILAPGIGAQGATPKDLGRLFSPCLPGSVLANVSRSLLLHGPSVDKLREEVVRLQGELREAFSK